MIIFKRGNSNINEGVISMKTIKRILLSVVALSLLVTLAACSSSTAAEGKVVIYTNGDEAGTKGNICSNH